MGGHMGEPFYNGFKGCPCVALLRGPDRGQTGAHGDAPGVHGIAGNIGLLRKGGGDDGARAADLGGGTDGDNMGCAVFQLVDELLGLTQVGGGGGGNFPGKAGIYILGRNILAIGEGIVRIDNLQRKDMDPVALAQLGSHISTGIGDDGNFLFH